jgi:hypothetical protein
MVCCRVVTAVFLAFWTRGVSVERAQFRGKQGRAQVEHRSPREGLEQQGSSADGIQVARRTAATVCPIEPARLLGRASGGACSAWAQLLQA